MSNCPTPHIAAKEDEIAKTVLMPGDPNRSKFIAENFLSNIKLVNNIRGVQGYTGEYKNTPVTVMASGMGMPSMGIYSYELFKFYDVDNIIRVGSCGAINNNVEVMDIVIGLGASTDSRYDKKFKLPGTFAPICDFSLAQKAAMNAEKSGAKYHVGNVLSSDSFYDFDPKDKYAWAAMGVLAIEMESAALYMNAAITGKKALGIFTVSDQLIKEQYLSSQERETGFTKMIEIALSTAEDIYNEN
ncbi:MAG: purine-nucleoside phosphorylase [Clostridia bacterium]|nr:purine-nucleoside phosphorylase [Clostridia bacterium]